MCESKQTRHLLFNFNILYIILYSTLLRIAAFPSLNPSATLTQLRFLDTHNLDSIMKYSNNCIGCIVPFCLQIIESLRCRPRVGVDMAFHHSVIEFWGPIGGERETVCEESLLEIEEKLSP